VVRECVVANGRVLSKKRWLGKTNEVVIWECGGVKVVCCAGVGGGGGGDGGDSGGDGDDVLFLVSRMEAFR
jgi:hypothetical protein